MDRPDTQVIVIGRERKEREDHQSRRPTSPRVARTGRDIGFATSASGTTNTVIWLGEEASGSKASQARDGCFGKQDGADSLGRHGEENELSAGVGRSGWLT